jgi:hypothetical protein
MQYDVINGDQGPMNTWTLYYSPAVGPMILGAATPLGYIDFTGTIFPQGGSAYTTLFNAGFGLYSYNSGAPWAIDYEPDHITFIGTAGPPPGLPANDGVGYLNPTPYLPSFAIDYDPSLGYDVVPASARIGNLVLNGTVYGPVSGTNNPCISIQVSNIVVETCSNCVSVSYSATAFDNCCSNVVLHYNPPSGTCFPKNSVNPVEVVASDSCGNVATNHFTVTVNPGPNCDPTNCITINASNIVAYTCAPCTSVPFNATAVDPCCSSFSLTYNIPATTCFPKNSSTPVQVTVTDLCGNSATKWFTVTVLPGPNCGNSNCISLYATNIIAFTCSNCTTVAFSPLVFDQCCTNVMLAYNPPANTCFPVNTTTPVQITAYDDCGNAVSKWITVTVQPGANCGGSHPQLSIATISGKTNRLTISWTAANAQLEESADLVRWATVPGATNSPYETPTTAPRKFFRLRVP